MEQRGTAAPVAVHEAKGWPADGPRLRLLLISASDLSFPDLSRLEDHHDV